MFSPPKDRNLLYRTGGNLIIKDIKKQIIFFRAEISIQLLEFQLNLSLGFCVLSFINFPRALVGGFIIIFLKRFFSFRFCLYFVSSQDCLQIENDETENFSWGKFN